MSTTFKRAADLHVGDVFLTNGPYSNKLTPWREVSDIELRHNVYLGADTIHVHLRGQATAYPLDAVDWVECLISEPEDTAWRESSQQALH